MSVITCTQSMFIVDYESERNTSWPNGSRVYCKNTGKMYILDGTLWAGNYEESSHLHQNKTILDDYTIPITNLVDKTLLNETLTTVVRKDEMGTPSGWVSLDANGKVDIAQLPLGTTTNSICSGSDSRLTDSRSPLTHTHTASDISGTAVVTNDSRLSDARMPITHTHTEGDVTNLTSDLSGKAATVHTHGPTDITGTAVVTNDSRLSDSRTPLTHTHSPTDVTGTAVITNDSRLSDSRTPTSHVHGNITNAGAIGSTTNLPIITTTSGVLTTGSFGTGANTFTVGNDSRLSDARTPTAHNQDANTITTGTLDGDRLPALSTTKKGGVPATGTPSGKYLKDDGTWATISSGSTPTGTGWRHVTSGVEDSTTSTPTAADVGALATTAFVGFAKITVGTSQPVAPNVGDLWVDLN